MVAVEVQAGAGEEQAGGLDGVGMAEDLIGGVFFAGGASEALGVEDDEGADAVAIGDAAEDDVGSLLRAEGQDDDFAEVTRVPILAEEAAISVQQLDCGGVLGSVGPDGNQVVAGGAGAGHGGDATQEPGSAEGLAGDGCRGVEDVGPAELSPDVEAEQASRFDVGIRDRDQELEVAVAVKVDELGAETPALAWRGAIENLLARLESEGPEVTVASVVDDDGFALDAPGCRGGCARKMPAATEKDCEEGAEGGPEPAGSARFRFEFDGGLFLGEEPGIKLDRVGPNAAAGAGHPADRETAAEFPVLGGSFGDVQVVGNLLPGSQLTATGHVWGWRNRRGHACEFTSESD